MPVGESSKGDQIVTVGGAQSSHVPERFDLVPVEGSRLTARRFGEGATKYEPNQWKKGDADFIRERINHLLNHVHKYVENGGHYAEYAGGDDDLSAILWAGHALAWFRVNKPVEYLRAFKMIHGEKA